MYADLRETHMLIFNIVRPRGVIFSARGGRPRLRVYLSGLQPLGQRPRDLLRSLERGQMATLGYGDQT